MCQLQSLLGLAGYYRKFIAGFAKIASPLFSLLSTTDTSRSKKTPLNWTDDTQTAFDQLRTILTTHPFLILPNFDLNYILDTDACGYAVGAVLSQTTRQPSTTSGLLLKTPITSTTQLLHF